MTQETPSKQPSPGGHHLAGTFNRGIRPHRRGMFGVAEILGLAATTLVVVAVLFSYFYFLLPAQSRLESQQRERDRLQTKVRVSSDVINQDLDTKAIVDKIKDSLDGFEARTLIEPARGRMDLYDELNDLIRKDGLRNTSGPTYSSLEPLGSKTVGAKTTTTKWRSVYPGIAVAVTVEGQYQSLRRFIRDIETSKRFLIINSVELERASQTNAPLSADDAPGSTESPVSLRLELATYFRRTEAE